MFFTVTLVPGILHNIENQPDDIVEILNEVIQKTLNSINAVDKLCRTLFYNYKMHSIFLRQEIVAAILNRIRIRDS